ncbi:MAG: hypothetical protein KFW09_04710 [Oscillospiraceae bacterium]|nr:hypothetical protein [Oscillospiraceae bacterium]
MFLLNLVEKTLVKGKTYWIDKNENMWDTKKFTKQKAIHHSTYLTIHFCFKCINCIQCGFSNNLENCYNVDYSKYSKNLKSCSNCDFCKDCIDCHNCKKSVGCISSTSLVKCKNVIDCNVMFFSSDCIECKESFYCKNSSHIYKSTGIKNKSYIMEQKVNFPC